MDNIDWPNVISRFFSLAEKNMEATADIGNTMHSIDKRIAIIESDAHRSPCEYSLDETTSTNARFRIVEKMQQAYDERLIVLEANNVHKDNIGEAIDSHNATKVANKLFWFISAVILAGVSAYIGKHF